MRRHATHPTTSASTRYLHHKQERRVEGTRPHSATPVWPSRTHFCDIRTAFRRRRTQRRKSASRPAPVHVSGRMSTTARCHCRHACPSSRRLSVPSTPSAGRKATCMRCCSRRNSRLHAAAVRKWGSAAAACCVRSGTSLREPRVVHVGKGGSSSGRRPGAPHDTYSPAVKDRNPTVRSRREVLSNGEGGVRGLAERAAHLHEHPHLMCGRTRAKTTLSMAALVNEAGNRSVRLTPPAAGPDSSWMYM